MASRSNQKGLNETLAQLLPKLKQKPWILVMACIAIIGAVALAIVLLSGSNTKGTSSSAGSSNITLKNTQPIGSPIDENESTLAQWKDDPAYKHPLSSISYAELFRHNDKYIGKFVHYRGEVIQVLGDSENWNLRVNITKKGDTGYYYWEDTVFIFSYSPDRVIENDIIDFTAQVNGVETYQSVMGGDITIPSLTIYEQKVVGRAE